MPGFLENWWAVILCQIAIGVALCCMACEAKTSPSLEFLKNIVKDEGAYQGATDRGFRGLT